MLNFALIFNVFQTIKFFQLLDIFEHPAMIVFFAEKGEKDFILLHKKWVILNEMVYILGIPYRATISLQIRDLTLSDVYGIWLEMQLHIKSCVQNVNFKTTLAQQLQDALIRRKENIFANPFMASALYLDPRYRSEVMKDSDKIEQAKNTLINLWHRINQNTIQVDNELQSNETSAQNITMQFNESDELEKHLNGSTSNDMANTGTNIEFLINNFDPSRLSSKESILQFWENSEKDHPELYALATVVYSIPPTEVQIERDFSKLNYVFNDRRCSLIADRLEDIMILNLNLNTDLFYITKERELNELKKQL